jgi:hypothetical protein
MRHRQFFIQDFIFSRKRDRHGEPTMDPQADPNSCLDKREISVKCLLSSLAEKDKIVQKAPQVRKILVFYIHK